jgi:hypothetical protein
MPKVMNCEICGDIPMAYLSGYAVGDTLLEGVRFEIRIVKDKVTATTHQDAKGYMSDLNEKKWLREAAKMADGYDNLQCSECRRDVVMEDR